MALRVELPGFYIDDVVVDGSPTRPVLVNRLPEAGEVQVPVGSTIVLEVVDVGPDGIDRNATQVVVDGQLAFVGGGLPEFQAGFDGPDATVVQTADTLRIILDPTGNFTSLQSVNVHVVSATLVSLLPLDETYAFTIQDLTAPGIALVQAVGPRTVRVTFDEAVSLAGDGASGDALASDHYGFDTATTPAVSLTPVAVDPLDARTIDIEVDFDMSQRATYALTVTDVADAFGNAIAPSPGLTASFIGYVPPNRPKDRRFELIRLLPQINREMDDTQDLRRFLAVLQDVLEVLLSEIDRFVEIIDPDLAPEPFLDLMLEDLGNPFAFDLTALQKRRLVSLLVQIYKQKGTGVGIQNAIRFFLGVNVTAVGTSHGATLVLGESELGIDWKLGPAEQFGLYAFDVLVDRGLVDVERKQIREIVDFMRPGHTHFMNLIEPP